MKKNTRITFVISMALALVMLISGCAPATPAATSAPTSPPAAATDAPTVAPTEEAKPGGGRVVVLISEDLETLNPYLTTALITGQVTSAMIEPLVITDANGEYQPVLAEEVPTEANGDVTDSGATVTWRLRQDVSWSDGTPFTAADVLFTYDAASNADSGSVRSGGFAAVQSIAAPDDYTVVVKYDTFNSSYLDLFKWGILPQSAGDATDMLNWDFNRQPVTTGPFMFKEWVSGDHISLVRNTYYGDAMKPDLDEVVFQVVPSEEVRVQMMLAGDAQVMLWPGSNLRETWEASDNVTLSLAPGIYILRMFLNLSMPGDNDPGPTPPHPILGDERVRQALDLGIDMESIVNDLAMGRVTRVASPFAVGWYDCGLTGNSYDPDAASALLEEAGWTDTDGDGIREAHGALYAPDGTLLSLSMVGYTDFKLLEQTELVIADNLKEIGVEIKVSNQEMAVLFGGWADKAPRKMGDYDILMYDTGAGINPQQHISDYFLSTNIPTDENSGVGANYTRWVDLQADDLITQASHTVDLADRKTIYCELAKIFHDSYSQIYLYQFMEGHAFNNALTGYQVSTWAPLTWDVANWKLGE